MNTEKNIVAMMKRFTGAEFKVLFLVSTIFLNKQFTIKEIHEKSYLSLAATYSGLKFLIQEGFVEQVTFPKTRDEYIFYKSTKIFNLKAFMEKDVYGDK